MGSILASSIFELAENILHDEAASQTERRWPYADMLEYLNLGQRTIVFFKPGANAEIESVQLAAGTKQTIPTASLQLIKIIRNMGAAGTTPGNIIRIVDQEEVDANNPEWHTETASATVEHYMYDDRFPRNFYVSPPQPAASMGYIEIATSKAPDDVEADPGPSYDVAISLDDTYEHCLLNFILYMAYLKDSGTQAGASRAMSYWNQFLQGVGRADLIGKIKGPNAPNPTPSPSILK